LKEESSVVGFIARFPFGGTPLAIADEVMARHLPVISPSFLDDNEQSATPQEK
jgi:hypothetical protein